MSGLDPTEAALTPGEAGTAFTGLDQYDRLVLAVSGGADSTALMLLVAAWARTTGCLERVAVVTVDHGLRPGSAGDAADVVAAARRFDLDAQVMTNTQPPAVPFSQAWARNLRYDLLLCAACDGLGPNQRAAIVTAHHQDDQAETLLMRLARGSGIDGLAAMRRVSSTADARVDLVRPLLGFSKARLRATLRAERLGWSDDPSNADDRFERVRVRAARPVLETLGLTSAALALSAHRAARASEALHTLTRIALKDVALISFEPFGVVRLDWQRLLQHPAEIRLRVLSGAIGWLSAERISLAALERLTEGNNWQAPSGATLSHVQLSSEREGLLLLPEAGRLGPRALSGEPQRFGAFDCQGRHGLTLQPLGSAGLKSLPAIDPGLPRSILVAQPAAVAADGTLISAPTLGFGPDAMTAVLRSPPGLANILHVPI